MTIAFDAKRYFNNATGLGFFSRTLLEGLRRFYPEHQYLLYTPYNRGQLAVATDGMRLPDSWLGRAFHPLWRSRGITQQLKRDGVELFHGLSHELPLGLRRAGIRSVVSVHDLIFLRYPNLYPAVDRFFYEQKYRRAAEQADRVVAISNQTRADLQEFFKIPAQHVRVIGQSCDDAFERLSLRHLPDRLALEIPKDLGLPASDYLISVGSLTLRKNWHTLLAALFLLKEEGFDLPLVAVGTGKGAYPEGLRLQAKKLGLQVFWLDHYVPTQELALLYRRAAALVYPSVFEGFGIPILEAMTVGIPVVTSRGGCFEEVGGSAAIYANPKEAPDLAEQISRVLDPGVRADLISKMPAQIEQFSPSKICAAWMEVYKSV
ncbi:MAG: glycosyltransferase family 1 protein [Saprospiraceae bacterium]|nr:glycosyltransferase family 1 protein [Saprospiraceae bacterium]